MKRYTVHKVNQLSMNLLVSYLSILAIPLLAIIIIYFTASDLLISLQKEKMYAALNSTALDVSRSMVEAGNLGIYVSNSIELKALCGRIENDRDYYDMYAYIRTLSDYSMFNEAIDGVYIFFDEGDYLVKNMVVVPADDRGYSTVGRLGDLSFDELMGQLRDQYFNGQILQEMSAVEASGDWKAADGEKGETEAHREKGEMEADGEGDQVESSGSMTVGQAGLQIRGNKLVLLQSFPYNGYENPKGTLAVAINDNVIEQHLRTNLIKNEGITLMIYDGPGNPVIQKAILGTGNRIDLEELSLEQLLNEKNSEITMGGGRYIVSRAKDPIYPFYYVSMVPKNAVLAQIGYIKYVIVALCVCSILTGLSVCIGLWRKRRNVVLAFSRYHDEFGQADNGGKMIKSFWEGVPYLLDNAANLQTTLKLQKNFMRTAVVRRLLYGEYETEEELDSDLLSADVVLKGNGYYAVLVALREASFQEEARYWNELRLCVKQYMEEKICIPNYYCELDTRRAAVIFPVNSGDSLQILRSALNDFMESLMEEMHLEVYIGIGRYVTQRLEIATSYDDAREVADYLVFHDIRTVMEKSELPRQTDSFFFPMETEVHLVRVIRQGNLEELEDIFRVLNFENFTYRKLSTTMVGHLLDLVRGTAVRALREEEQADEAVIERLYRAETLTGLWDVLKEALPGVGSVRSRKESQSAELLKEEVKKYIAAHYGEPEFTLCQLAEAVGMSENKLYKQFKGLFGMSFSEYLENVRINKACELLKAQIPVKDVAVQTGYGSDFSFRRAFKRVMGLAPSYYAEGLGEKK